MPTKRSYVFHNFTTKLPFSSKKLTDCFFFGKYYTSLLLHFTFITLHFYYTSLLLHFTFITLHFYYTSLLLHVCRCSSCVGHIYEAIPLFLLLLLFVIIPQSRLWKPAICAL